MVIKGPGFSNGTIILEEPDSVVYSGQILSGNVHFDLYETLNYSAINLVYLGEASVERTEMLYEKYGGANRYRKVKYEGREQYFNTTQCVSGGAGVSTLQPGVHSIPFQFHVPLNAPSSVMEEDGAILYSITAYLEYPEPGRREELVMDFYVVAPISPNAMANMMRPLVIDLEEVEDCQCFCRIKMFNMKICLASGVFQVGSTIPITLKVQSNSRVEIYRTSFKITKRVTYRTQSPPSEYTVRDKTMISMKVGQIKTDARGQYSWELPLPPYVLPNLEACSIIDISYFFKVIIQMTGCNVAAEEETEILIGILPQTDAALLRSPELASQLPKAPVPDLNLPIGLVVPGLSQPGSSDAFQQQASQLASTLERKQKDSYEIGFRSSVMSSAPPYPSSSMSSGYPYSLVSPTDTGIPSDPSDIPMYNLNSSESNIPLISSAPPL